MVGNPDDLGAIALGKCYALLLDIYKANHANSLKEVDIHGNEQNGLHVELVDDYDLSNFENKLSEEVADDKVELT